MIEFLTAWYLSTWQMLVDSALLLMIGLGLAGFIRLWLSERQVQRHIGRGGARPVIMASLIGVPLPLCSCSVLPVAYQLRKAGLSKGATVSFLISTPETGVDSILLTWSLTDPLMTVARPVTAFLTAVITGLSEESAGARRADRLTSPIPPTACGDNCGCHQDSKSPGGVARRLVATLRYAYNDLLADLAPYLLVGYVLAGLVAVAWGNGAGHLPAFLTHGWGAYIGAVLIGLPLYICATSSTPLAAALMGLGFPPGAALVFLMVGPATNLASLAVVAKVLSRAEIVRYLLGIIIVSVLCGLALDWLYGALGVDPVAAITRSAESDPGWYHLLAAALLSVGIVWHSAVAALRRRK